mmetsp:Transcript_73893/g.175882  ORF Transcript_73893/g.175882 Transcript_73893/m.175882 type:complete len:471 (+) Transcript_73893:167-1579(+)
MCGPLYCSRHVRPKLPAGASGGFAIVLGMLSLRAEAAASFSMQEADLPALGSEMERDCSGGVQSPRSCLLQDWKQTKKVLVEGLSNSSNSSTARVVTASDLLDGHKTEAAVAVGQNASLGEPEPAWSSGDAWCQGVSKTLDSFRGFLRWLAVKIAAGVAVSDEFSTMEMSAELNARPAASSPFLLLFGFGLLSVLLVMVLLAVLGDVCNFRRRRNGDGEAQEEMSSFEQTMAWLGIPTHSDDHKHRHKNHHHHRGGHPQQPSALSTTSLVATQHCCPDLLVPEDTECILLVPMVDINKQALELVDTNGNLVLKAYSQKPKVGPRRLTLQTASGEVMAHAISDRSRFSIMQASGEVFGTISRIGNEYGMKTRTGGRFLFWGHLDQHTINVSDMSIDDSTRRAFEEIMLEEGSDTRTAPPQGSMLAATTEPVSLGSGSDLAKAAKGPNYMLRVGPLMDVGLITCSLLALDHL